MLYEKLFELALPVEIFDEAARCNQSFTPTWGMPTHFLKLRQRLDTSKVW